MGEYDSIIDQLSDERLDKLRRADLSAMSLDEIVAPLLSIRKDVTAANLTPGDELPRSQVNSAREVVLRDLPNLLSEISSWNPATDSNATSTRNRFIQQIESFRDSVATGLRPYLRPDFVGASVAERQVQELLATLDKKLLALDVDRKVAQRALAEGETALKAALADAESTLERLKTEAVQDASRRASSYYKTAADGHARVASNYLKTLGGLAIALIVAVPVVFSVATSDSPVGTASLIRDLSTRVAILLILAAAVAFCARNYRINKHLEVLNRTRYNTLETAGLYVAGVSEEARSIVVSELVRSVFTPGDTGYMITDREQTIIENPGSALAFLGTNGKPG